MGEKKLSVQDFFKSKHPKLNQHAEQLKDNLPKWMVKLIEEYAEDYHRKTLDKIFK